MNLTRFFAYSWENYVNKSKNLMNPFLVNSICLTLRLIEELGVGCLGVCIPQITFERTFATIFRNTYEKKGAKLGIGMTVQTYLAAASFSFGVIFYQIFISQDYKMNQIYPTCRLEAHHTFVYFGIWIVAFFIASNSTAFLFLAYYYNRREHRQKESLRLSTRYQFKENVQTLRSLLPPISFFMLSDLLGLFCIFYVLFWDGSNFNIMVVLQLLHIIPQLFCISTILWFMFSFKSLKQRILNDFTFRLSKQAFRNKVSATNHASFIYTLEDTQENHFASLVGSWDIKFVQNGTNQ